MPIAEMRPEEAAEFSRELDRLMHETLRFPEEAFRHFHRSEEDLRRHRGLLLAAREDGAIAGLLVGTAPEGGVATIVWVLVDPKRQRRHIGSKLMDEACRRYTEMSAHKVKLTVPDEQTVKFYEKQGLVVEGRHPNHWWKMDFWAMGKDL